MSDSKNPVSEGLAHLLKVDDSRVPAVVVLDRDAVRDFIATMSAVAAQLGAMAEAVQAQAVALNALADAIAAPIEDQEQADTRPRYLNGDLIEDG